MVDGKTMHGTCTTVMTSQNDGTVGKESAACFEQGITDSAAGKVVR